MAHAAQIAFALFPDIADKQERSVVRNPELDKGGGEREQGGNPGGVIRYAGAEQLAPLLTDVERRARRKDGIDMGADGNRGNRQSRLHGDYVADSIPADIA